MKKYACSICRYVYDPGQSAVQTDLEEVPVIVPDEVFYNQSALVDDDDVIEIPKNWVCPQCGSTGEKLRPIDS